MQGDVRGAWLVAPGVDKPGHGVPQGLEWDAVFIVRANDGELPLRARGDGESEQSGVEEERRLCYGEAAFAVPNRESQQCTADSRED